MSASIPDFYIIGAPKSGTTSLYDLLSRHPSIYMTPVKEPTFFSDPNVFRRGFSWYESLYSQAAPGQLRGEASTTYARWPHTLDTPKLIFEYSPEAKFIYIMRNPVDRAYSHYLHHMRSGVDLSFEAAIEQRPVILDSSRYYMQIERYLRYFDREQFLLLWFEDLFTLQAQWVELLCDFLGVDSRYFDDVNKIPKSNIGGGDHYLRYKAFQRLKKNSLLTYAVKALPSGLKRMGFSFLKASAWGRSLSAEWQPDPISSEMRLRLEGILFEDNKRLFEFLGTEREGWMSKR